MYQTVQLALLLLFHSISMIQRLWLQWDLCPSVVPASELRVTICSSDSTIVVEIF